MPAGRGDVNDRDVSLVDVPRIPTRLTSLWLTTAIVTSPEARPRERRANRRLYVQLGAAIRKSREGASLSQAELAEAVGLGRTSITNFESGRQHIPLHTLYDIARVLDVELVDVLPKADGLDEVALYDDSDAERWASQLTRDGE